MLILSLETNLKKGLIMALSINLVAPTAPQTALCTYLRVFRDFVTAEAVPWVWTWKVAK